MPSQHKPFDIIERTQRYTDAVNREEIHNILRVISMHVESSNGEDLALLKKYLRKLVDY
jgi:hypothetical protein